MKRSDLTEKLLDIKREKGWSWKYICDKVGGYSEVLIVGAILGQMKLTKPQAANAGELFGLSKSEVAMLNEIPMRGTGTPMPPTDPLIYRFYEMVMVNGPAWKALIEEEFGDGIMSAIDFDMAIERVANPKGDRVKITMSGKFLQILWCKWQRAGIWVQGRLRASGESRVGFPIRYSPLPICLFARLHLGRCHRSELVHLGANRLLCDGNAFGRKVAQNLAQDVTVAGFLEIRCDHLLGIGRGRIARDAELLGGPQAEHPVAAGLSLEFLLLV